MQSIKRNVILKVFEGNPNDGYAAHRKILTECLFKNKFLSIHSFKVNAKAWKNLSATNRFVEVTLPELTSEACQAGNIIVFLQDHEKHAPLPFIYYQLRTEMASKTSEL